MVVYKSLCVFTLLISFGAGLLSSCADSNFLDKSKKDQSILMGNEVEYADPLAEKVVFIARDFNIQDEEPLFFSLCTGLIIDPFTVLTASHCLEKGTSDLKIILNPNPRIYPVFTKDIYSISNYESYTSTQDKNSQDLEFNTDNLPTTIDLALLRLDRPLQSKYKATPLVQAVPQTTNDSLKATVAGFGKTTALKNTSQLDYKKLNGFLNKAAIQIKKTDLIKNYFSIPQWKKSGVCHGDSGAPVFVEINGETQAIAMGVGVYSKESADYNECSGFGYYLNLIPFSNWIHKTRLSLEKKDTTQ